MSGNRQPGQDRPRQALRPRQQAEQDEHRDLREPGRGVEESDHRIVGPDRAVSDHQPGDVDGEESRPVNGLGEPEDDDGAGGDEGRVQPLRQIEPVEHQHHRAAAEVPDQPTEQRLPHQEDDDLGPGLAPHQQDLHQNDGEEDRDRIVDAGFDLQRGIDARSQPQPTRVQQEEDRGGIGGGDDGAHQQRFGQAQAQRPRRRRRGQRSGDEHAHGRQHPGRPDHVAEDLEPGSQAAVEQDEPERHRADGVGNLHVVELDAEWAGLAGRHSDDQKH
jgi:hypothetical protein